MASKGEEGNLRYVLKVDLDVHLPQSWMEEFISTRRAILQSLDFEVVDVVVRDTERGHHFWFHIISKKELEDMEINKLQFLLGDDVGRVLINAYRIKRGVKRWNKLFSRVLWRKRIPTYMQYRMFVRKLREGESYLSLQDAISIDLGKAGKRKINLKYI